MSKRNRKRQRSKVLILTVFLTVLLVLSACQGSNTSSQTTETETAKETSHTETDSRENSVSEESSSIETEKEPGTADTEEKTEVSSSDTETGTTSETDSETEPDTSSETDTETDASSDTGSESSSDEVQDTSSEEESGSSETETSESVSEDPGPDQSYVRFFGHLMEASLAEINRKTLADPASMLFDVAEDYVSFTAGEVLQKINAYTLPDTSVYGNVLPDDNIKNTLLAARNTAPLEADPGKVIIPEYAILTENTSVRGFPTELKARNSLDEGAFDYFQETVLNYGNGVLVLHYTQDRTYAFVQGYNYAGWVLTSCLGMTDRATYKTFLNQDSFLICTHPDVNDPKSRLGIMLPYREKNGTVYTVIYPERDENGQLYPDERELDIAASSSSWSDGFLPFSEEEIIRRACLLTDLTYGWGDEGNRYDCSSTTGLLYLLFGIYMPRNTSIMPSFGGGVQNLSEAEDRDQAIEAHPGALLLMPGHVMMYLYRSEDGKHVVLHNTVYNGAYRVIISRLEDMQTASGASYRDLLSYIIYIQK